MSEKQSTTMDNVDAHKGSDRGHVPPVDSHFDPRSESKMLGTIPLHQGI